MTAAFSGSGQPNWPLPQQDPPPAPPNDGPAVDDPEERVASVVGATDPKPVPKGASGMDSLELDDSSRSVDIRVVGNHDSRIIVAAGPVTMSGKQPLTVADVAESELRVTRIAWVSRDPTGESVSTASDAVAVLSAEGAGLVVVAGPAGYGKRTAGIRALWEVARSRIAHDKPLVLKEIQPDWDDPALPDTSLLPDAPNTGYLLDVAAEMSSWTSPSRTATALAKYAERLARIRSCLVVIADERSWPQDAAGVLGRTLVRAKTKPSAHLVAKAHLEYLHNEPGRAALVTPATAGSPAGQAAHLLTEESSPAAGERLASGLAGTDGSPEGIATALSEFQEWRTDVSDVFKATIDKPEDRALLIASLFLDGEDALTIQEGARTLLDEAPRESVREILSGPDLSARLTDVGANVSGRRAAFEHKPGYPRAVLLHLWHQRADIHDPLLKWLDGVVSVKGSRQRLAPISDLLVELAIAESDIRVIDKIKKWINDGCGSFPGTVELGFR